MAADPFAVMLLSFATAEDRLKLLLWDGLGFWLVYRRLDQGRLHWPRADAGAIELSAAQWAMLVEGARGRRYRAWKMHTNTAVTSWNCLYK
ncbi:IS66 family insertion sequence element accessory protein TnpB [Acidithiobacillus ferrooxidans]|uniref:IS66 family insertion sequence element accessory protein TnpB n=1 Tax=Acidithiobacillus ferrooxidans TaxID=920 RepID=UPI001C60BEAC|nr:IS66 family insertion sequence element accessory protein TnpB [Acidithiobacillus ferrooxidans]